MHSERRMWQRGGVAFTVHQRSVPVVNGSVYQELLYIYIYRKSSPTM